MQVLHRRYLAIPAIAFTLAIPFVHFDLPINVALPDVVLGMALKWAWTLMLALIVFAIERRPLKFLQFEGFGVTAAVLGFATVVAAMVLAGVLRSLLAVPPSVDSAADGEPASLWIRLAGAVTAGICEEFMFRGFLIEEAGEWIRSRKIAGILVTLAFAAAHWDQGWVQAIIGPGIVGAAFTLVYFHQKSLPLCMFLHSAVDVCYELAQ